MEEEKKVALAFMVLYDPQGLPGNQFRAYNIDPEDVGATRADLGQYPIEEREVIVSVCGFEVRDAQGLTDPPQLASALNIVLAIDHMNGSNHMVDLLAMVYQQGFKAGYECKCTQFAKPVAVR